MTVHAPPELEEGAQLLEATVRPILEKLGAVRVDIVARGSPGWVKYWVGYQLGPGVQRTEREMNDPVVFAFPASLTYTQLSVVPVERLPETDPGMLAAERALRRPPLKTMIGFGIVALIFVGVFGAPLFFGRGGLLGTAPLRGAGTAEARFVSEGEAVELWASLDGSWTGKPNTNSSKTLRKIVPVHYEVDLVHDGKVVRHLSLDTQVSRPSQKIYCSFAPDCEVFVVDVPPLPPGPILVRVTGTPRDDVTQVDDMSLNVRKGTFF